MAQVQSSSQQDGAMGSLSGNVQYVIPIAWDTFPSA